MKKDENSCTHTDFVNSENVTSLLSNACFDTLIGSIEAKLQSTFSDHTTGNKKKLQVSHSHA
jgi:hypothetical protein